MATSPERIIEAGRLALSEEASLAEVHRAIEHANAADVFAPEVSPLPKRITVTEDLALTLKHLPGNIQTAQLPNVRRALTEPERESLLSLLDEVKATEKLLKNTTESLKAAWFNHFDSVAEKEGRADENTPRDRNGWYLLEDRENGTAADTDVIATREIRQGAVSLTAENLKALEDAGQLSHEDYLALTKQTRVVDEDHFLKALAQREHLIPVVAQAIEEKPPTIAFCKREKKS